MEQLGLVDMETGAQLVAPIVFDDEWLTEDPFDVLLSKAKTFGASQVRRYEAGDITSRRLDFLIVGYVIGLSDAGDQPLSSDEKELLRNAALGAALAEMQPLERAW